MFWSHRNSGDPEAAFRLGTSSDFTVHSLEISNFNKHCCNEQNVYKKQNIGSKDGERHRKASESSNKCYRPTYQSSANDFNPATKYNG